MTSATLGAVSGTGHSAAYGFRIVVAGAEEPLPGLVAAEEGAETAHVACEVGPIEADLVEAGEQRVTLAVARGLWIDVVRATNAVTIRVPERPEPAGLVHPLLTAPLAILNRWRGRAGLHAGAVVHDGGAIVVCGHQGAGKSSTLAACAHRGLPVVSDDLVVVDGADVLAGPACVDLRPDVARRYADAEPLGIIGQRERFRLPTPAAPPRTPLRAVVLLEWADEAEPEAIPLTLLERAELVHALDYAAVAGLPRGAALLDLLGLPMWRLRRRRDASADSALDAITTELDRL